MTLESQQNSMNAISDSDWNNVLLYVTNDASLDRPAFESQLESDPVLCEQIADAVLWIEKIKQSDSKYRMIGVPPVPTTTPVSHNVLWYQSWQGLLAISASIGILIVATSWQMWSQGMLAVKNDARVLVAWADLRCTSNYDAGSLDDVIDGSDVDLDDEFPEWLITATLVEESVTKEQVQ